MNYSYFANNIIRIIKNLPLIYHNSLIDPLDANINVYRDENLADKNIRDQIFLSYRKFCISLDINRLIGEIWNSYHKDHSKVTKQLNLDFPRMEIYLNSIKCQNIKILLNHYQNFNKYVHHDMDNLFNLLALFTTQATFYNMYDMISKVYSSMEDNIHILDGDDHPQINIIHRDNTINIILKKKFKYLDINNEKIILYFQAFMIIFIELYHNPHISDSKYYCNCRDAIIYWYPINV